MKEDQKQEQMGLQLEVDYIAGGTFYTGFAKYITTEGLFVTTTKVAQPGEIIFMDIYLPNYRHKLKLKGRVIKSYEYSVDDTPPGMEVKFLGLREQFREVIAEFISSFQMEEEM